jgi:hypothetical protein
VLVVCIGGVGRELHLGSLVAVVVTGQLIRMGAAGVPEKKKGRRLSKLKC